MFEITSDFVWQAIQPRPRDAHKGDLWLRAGGGG